MTPWRDGGFNTLLYAEFKTGRPGEARENLFWVQPRAPGKEAKSIGPGKPWGVLEFPALRSLRQTVLDVMFAVMWPGWGSRDARDSGEMAIFDLCVLLADSL
ncbi:hypothetical protein N7456_009777 [Penicillium angulare]|uniref:Uncharacterized protein n=1 Tax=Penicillium angulare TaxID=116970 RepID=A0A9W9K625_9EURO|nr:hypothetical protein N7456_009777 [Penicillium angulare]